MSSGDTTEKYAPENEKGKGDKRWIAILQGWVKASLIEEETLEMTVREPKVRVFQSPGIESAKTQSVKPPA